MNKQLISMTAVAAMAGAALAVESKNVVGYTSVTMDKQWTILGVNFTAADGTDLSIQDAIPYVDGMTKANAVNLADQIQIQNSAGAYDTYYMSNGKNGKNQTVSGLEGKWTRMGQFVVATTTLPPGTAFWFYRKDATNPLTIKIAGGVSKIASYDKQLDGTWKHIANPYPVDLPLNDGIPYVAGMTKANAVNLADQIQIQNSAGAYDTYYMSNGKNGKNQTVTGLEGKWTRMGQFAVTDAVIPAGKGAWFYRKGDTDFTITINRPYTIE